MWPSPRRRKPVKVDPRIYKNTVPRHRRLINDQWLESIVWDTPISRREYDEPYHFRIVVYKKTNGKVVKITVRVHERLEDFWIGIVHTEDRGHKR